MQAQPLPLHRLRKRLLRYVLGCASSLGSTMKPCLSNIGRYVRIQAPASPHLHGQIGRISGRRPEHYEVRTPLGFVLFLPCELVAVRQVTTWVEEKDVTL